MTSRVTRIMILAALLSAGVCTGAVWIETADAGRLTSTAQLTGGDGPLTALLGNLADLIDVDLYTIFITSPAVFSASTVAFPGLNIDDPQLFLFNSSGFGVYMNDDDESGLNGSQSALPAGHPFGPVTDGVYYLAVGWWDNEPLDLNGFIFGTAGFGTNGPNPGAGVLAAWDDNVTGRIDLPTSYEITLNGAAPVPEPRISGITGLLACGLIALSRIRPANSRQ